MTTPRLGPDGQRLTRDDWTDAGIVRRMIAKVTSKLAKWQVAGHKLLDGKIETRDAEIFQGVGFASRPKDKADAEVVVLFPGTDASAPVIVAARDLKTLRASVGPIDPDSTVIFTSKVIVLLKADGMVEIRSAAGTAKRLATVEDLEALKDAIANAVPVANDGGVALQAGIVDALADWPTGTTVLKAE